MARAAAVALSAAILALAGASGAVARWDPPVRLAGPEPDEVLPAQLAFSDTGAEALAFAVQDQLNTAASKAFTVTGSPSGAFGRPHGLPHTLEPLGLAYLGSALWALAGSAPSGSACCATVKVIDGTGSRPGATIVTGLTGATDGQLVNLPDGGLLAAVATQRDVWVAQSDAKARFEAATERLSFGGSPTDVAATVLAHGDEVVAFSDAATGGQAGATRILVARGSATIVPTQVRVAVTAPPGYSIDELALAPGAKSATVAWVQSWYDTLGAFHSAVMERDLSGPVHTVSDAGMLSSQVSLAGNAAGDQVLSWQSCDATGLCYAEAAVRRARGGFGAPVRLGAIDPTQTPAAAISAAGKALVGWVRGGHVVAAVHRLASAGFDRAQTISRTDLASALTLGFGPRGDALAAWTQGALDPELDGSFSRSP